MPLHVCDKCSAAMKKTGAPPAVAACCGMHRPRIPLVLARLNYYERLLIQRVKPFITVVQLKAVRGNSGVCAIKGLGVLLPLDISRTQECVLHRELVGVAGKQTACRHVAETAVTLPTRDALKVVVHQMSKADYELLKKDAVKKKGGKLVSLENVVDALKYLKKHNP